MDTSLFQRLWQVLRAVIYTVRKGIAKRKLMMDLHLLLHRGKIAGKAIGNLMTFHGGDRGHHHSNATSSTTTNTSFSCRALDPNLSVYNPRREVEFSCSNTPSYPSLHLPKRRRREHRNKRHHDNNDGGVLGYYNYDGKDIAKVFEILNNCEFSGDAESSSAMVSALATPSPAMWDSFGRSPSPVRQLRITDSPFLVQDDGGLDHGQVDREAEEFIKRFYEQLRMQQITAVATPSPVVNVRGRRQY